MQQRGESYDAVFRAVKSIHGIANPNMGFACQLLQWHARRSNPAQASPRTGPRLLRLAPHSQDDSCRLVLRAVPSPTSIQSLDPRGVFILRSPCNEVPGKEEIFVWRGSASRADMQEQGDVAALQLQRYEGAPPAQVENDGRESNNFMRALLSCEGEESSSHSGPTRAMCCSEYDQDFALLDWAHSADYRPLVPGFALTSRPGTVPCRPDSSGRLVPLAAETSPRPSTSQDPARPIPSIKTCSGKTSPLIPHPPTTKRTEVPSLRGTPSGQGHQLGNSKDLCAPLATPRGGIRSGGEERCQTELGPTTKQAPSLPTVSPASKEKHFDNVDGSDDDDEDDESIKAKAVIELYEYPDMEKLTLFDMDDLNPDGAYVLLVQPNADSENGNDASSVNKTILYVWMGSDYDGDNCEDGSVIGREFADEMGLKIEENQLHIEREGNETNQFWNWFENG